MLNPSNPPPARRLVVEGFRGRAAAPGHQRLAEAAVGQGLGHQVLLATTDFAQQDHPGESGTAEVGPRWWDPEKTVGDLTS